MSHLTQRFISLEGGEGVGKSTNLAFIAERLRATGLPVVVTREPGGTPLAEELRELLLTPRQEPVAVMTELLMLFAARAQHWQQVIKPALESGAWVLCDRFVDATYAYQVSARGMSAAAVATLEQLVLHGAEPSLTLLLDMPVSEGMQRAKARAAFDRFEQEQLAFFERVRAGYLARAAQAGERIRVIDASGSLAQVKAAVDVELSAYIGRLA
ncbi:MAG: dTMP kinase [Moraxellaceae bacterium]|nr:dTMP kinase [Moraxellaceae bacterium]MDZ4387516.1 dTMP kinase [Moraxellaceae bacterium]